MAGKRSKERMRTITFYRWAELLYSPQEMDRLFGLMMFKHIDHAYYDNIRNCIIGGYDFEILSKIYSATGYRPRESVAKDTFKVVDGKVILYVEVYDIEQFILDYYSERGYKRFAKEVYDKQNKDRREKRKNAETD